MCVCPAMRLVSALRPPVLLLLICVAVAGAGWSCAQGDDVDPFSRETLYLSSVCFDEESQGLVGVFVCVCVCVCV
mgnify:FL=1